MVQMSVQHVVVVDMAVSLLLYIGQTIPSFTLTKRVEETTADATANDKQAAKGMWMPTRQVSMEEYEAEDAAQIRQHCSLSSYLNHKYKCTLEKHAEKHGETILAVYVQQHLAQHCPSSLFCFLFYFTPTNLSLLYHSSLNVFLYMRD